MCRCLRFLSSNLLLRRMNRTVNTIVYQHPSWDGRSDDKRIELSLSPSKTKNILNQIVERIDSCFIQLDIVHCKSTRQRTDREKKSKNRIRQYLSRIICRASIS